MTSAISSDDTIDAILNELPSSLWQQAIKHLQERGVAVVELNTKNLDSNIGQRLKEIHQKAFDTARQAMDQVLTLNDDPLNVVLIQDDTDSAHATGFHTVGGMSSRYNAHREGFVFSDKGALNGRVLTPDNANNNQDIADFVEVFHQAQRSMFQSLHGIADHVLQAIESAMELPSQCFQQQLGPTQTSSQWHMKRYIMQQQRQTQDRINIEAETTESGQAILLPMHTDPSLISVVIHDWSCMEQQPTSSQRQISNNLMGLQVFDIQNSQWNDLYYDASSNSSVLATVFVGSVLSHITDRTWPAAKHRVVATSHSLSSRMAATLFVRPQLSALLPMPLPSPTLTPIKTANNRKSPITFGTWLQRVAKNYESTKKKKHKTTKTSIGNQVSHKMENSTAKINGSDVVMPALVAHNQDEPQNVGDQEEDPFAAFGSDDDDNNDDNDADMDEGNGKNNFQDNPFDAFGSDDEDEDDCRNEPTTSSALVAKTLLDAANEKLAAKAIETASGDQEGSSSEKQKQQLDLSYLQPLRLTTWPAPLYQGPILLVSALSVGGGRGYVASQPIPSGTLVLVEETMIEWPDEQLGKKLGMVSVRHLLEHFNAQRLVLDFETFHPTKEDMDSALASNENDLDEATMEQIIKMIKLVEAEYKPVEESESSELMLDAKDVNTSECKNQDQDDVINTLVTLAQERGIQSSDGSVLTRLDIVRLLLALRYNGLESGVYRHVAMLNHDDYPNCAKFMPDDRISYSEVRTTRPIAIGEPLTISYLPRIMCHASRRRHLWEQHRFDIGVNHLKGQRYKMELVGNSLPPSPLFQGGNDDSLTRRVERATEELGTMQKEVATDIQEGGVGDDNNSFETAKALELSSLELYTQAVEELLQNSHHILLIPILSLHVDSCACVLQDPSLKNAVRMGVLARQTLSIHRLLPLQRALLGPDHFELARTYLDFANAISELLSRSAKHLYELRLPSLETFSSWSSVESHSRKEHSRIKALYPYDASQLLLQTKT
ncbi:SET methyltransferase domain containing protein [Nitzschia inconspicua]|uniref:SET methyltransferase domain containing protein n=1 Tax=Nitzschia inconspicua TaxID=303405 RepID=A0A9K3Q6W1_9STRA|nr:SET methyltransferase domain containing protein [Nitzschia inconspicua]